MKQYWSKIFGSVISIILLSGCQTQESAKKTDKGYKPILTESTFKNWAGDPRFWRMEDGIVIGETSTENPAEENTFLIWKNGQPANFEAKFEYRFSKTGKELSGNSGLQFRSERLTDGKDSGTNKYSVWGYQADFAVSNWIPGIHYEEKGRGILARRGQSVIIDANGEKHVERFAEEELLGEYITHDKWNNYRVYANGDTLRAFINGKLMHEVIDQSAMARQKGVLAFQIHTGPPMRVELRNVQLKLLD